MSSTTNNGWPKDPAVTRVYVGGDSNGCEFASGDVAVVMKHFFDRFHSEVESVTALNGYRSTEFNNSLPGSSKTSNHISGTAGDVNGAKHPNEYAHGGKHLASGFTSAQMIKLRKLLSDFGGTVGWGGDYAPGIRDYMHFEIRGTRAQIAALAKIINPPPPPTPIPPTPAPSDNLEAVMPFPRYFKMEGTSLAYEDLGTARKRTSSQQYLRTMAQYPKGEPAIVDLPVNDPFFNQDIVGDDSYGEGYQVTGKPEVWVDAAKDGYHGRRYVDADTYAKRGGTAACPLRSLPASHGFWKLPVIGTPPPKA